MSSKPLLFPQCRAQKGMQKLLQINVACSFKKPTLCPDVVKMSLQYRNHCNCWIRSSINLIMNAGVTYTIQQPCMVRLMNAHQHLGYYAKQLLNFAWRLPLHFSNCRTCIQDDQPFIGGLGCCRAKIYELAVILDPESILSDGTSSPTPQI